MPDLYPFKAGEIEPIVLPDQTVGVWVNKTYKFYKVLYIEGVPRSDPIEHDFGALVAGASSIVTQLALLEMPDKEFGQFRAFVIDDIAASLWQGRSDGRYKLKNRVSRLTRWTDLDDTCGHTTEFYVHENNFAYMQVLNPGDYNLTQSRVAFYGFRYVLEDAVDAVGKSYVWVPGRKEHYVPSAWTRVPATAHL